MNHKIKYSIALNLIIPILVIISVFILEYVYLMQPCEMCLKERYPYYILILIGLFIIVFKKNKIIFLTFKIISILTIFLGMLYASKHVGIERGFIKGNTACSNNADAISTSDLLAIIESTPLIRCDEPTVLFNIISIAELNLITMFILLILNLFYLRK